MRSSIHPRHINTSNTILKANNTRRHHRCNNLPLVNFEHHRNNSTGNRRRKVNCTKSPISHHNIRNIFSRCPRKGTRRAKRNLLVERLQIRSRAIVPRSASNHAMRQ